MIKYIKYGSPGSLMRWLSENTYALEDPQQANNVEACTQAYKDYVRTGITFNSDASYEKLAKLYGIYKEG